jgi:hypothetical protein
MGSAAGDVLEVKHPGIYHESKRCVSPGGPDGVEEVLPNMTVVNQALPVK